MLTLFSLLIIVLYMFWDVNYFIRSLFTVLIGYWLQERCSLEDETVIYVIFAHAIFMFQCIGMFSFNFGFCCLKHGICTFQDCDVTWRYMRLARIIRELDIARFHFYVRTGVYPRSRQLGTHSLQGCTNAVVLEPVPLFVPYKVVTKLSYFDEKSLFMDHQVITLHDGRERVRLTSRQHSVGLPTNKLLSGLPGYRQVLHCPDHIQSWLQSMEVMSCKLRPNMQRR